MPTITTTTAAADHQIALFRKDSSASLALFHILKLPLARCGRGYCTTVYRGCSKTPGCPTESVTARLTTEPRTANPGHAPAFYDASHHIDLTEILRSHATVLHIV